MNLIELMRTLERQGVQLWLEDERLRYRAPSGALTEELRQAIVGERQAVVALLARAPRPIEGTKGTNALSRAVDRDFGAFSSFSGADAPREESPAVAAMARWRAALSERLQHWNDEQLQALAAWNIVTAFDRGGAEGFRRHLAPSLAALSDDDLTMLIDWPTLATLEQRLWQTDPSAAEHVSRGAQRLAVWWNAKHELAKRTEPAPKPVVGQSTPPAPRLPDV